MSNGARTGEIGGHGTPPRAVADVRARVADLLEHAARRYGDRPHAAEVLVHARQRLDAPLRVAIAGKVKAGKSTLLNALVGAPLAATDAGECTRVVTWYVDGLTYGATLYPTGDGPPRPLRFRRGDDAVSLDLDGADPAEIDRLEVTWPSARLRAMTLIDTPGIGSVSTTVSARTEAFVTPDDGPGAADAVCYLMRHLHALDARFLEAFRDGGAQTSAPMNAVAVLSRTDEIGGGRLGALQSAEHIAARYARDPQVRQLCQTVVPVAGLLASTAATLRVDEYDALVRLVGADRATLDDLVLSVDRFTAHDAPIDLHADRRRGLLDRFGVFGVRLSIALIRSRQATTASELATVLAERSGITALRDVLRTHFAARADLLKARAGLAAVTATIAAHPCDYGSELTGMVERVISETHEFAEARLLNALRTGQVELRDGADEAERLLGGYGSDSDARLGLTPAHATDRQRYAAAYEALARWRRSAERPLASRAAVEASRVVARSCEGILADLSHA